MALLLNNQIGSPSLNTIGNGGTQTSTPSTNSNGYVSPGSTNQAVPSLSAGIRTTLGNIGQAILPSATYTPYQAPSQPVTGLLSPSHPAVGSLPASSGIASHTVTTNPDNSVTSKVTYPTASSSASSVSTLPSAPVAPTAQATIPQNDPTYNPTTGSTANNPTMGNPYIAPLASAAQTGSANANQATTGLLQAPSQNAQIAQQAQQIADQASQEYQQTGAKGAALASGQLTGLGTNPVATGAAAVTDQTTAAQQATITGAENAALQGIGYQLTGQNQAQSGLEGAGGIANTQQQNVQSGLQQAGNLAQPQLGTIGQVPFSPIDENQGAPLGTTQPGGVAAAGNLLGQFQGAQALGAAQGTGTAQGIQAQAAAPGQTQASNIQTSGTSVTGANAAGLAQSIQQETTLDTAASNASALATQVQTALTSSGLNMTNSTDANTAINNLQSRLGNAAYTQLNVAVNDARNAYGAILQATGATPTDAGTAANQNINANMSPKQILAAIDQLSQGVSARQNSQHQQTLQYQQQLAGSGSGGSTGNSSINYNW